MTVTKTDAADLSATELLAAVRGRDAVPGRGRRRPSSTGSSARTRWLNAFCLVDEETTLGRPRGGGRAGGAASRSGRWTACPSRSRTSCSPAAGRRCAAPRRSTRRGPGTRTRRRWPGCASTARCSSARRPRRSSAGRASPTRPLHRRHPQPVGRLAHAGRVERRRGGGRRAGHGAAGARHRRRRLGAHPRRVHRHLRAQADVRPGPALSGEPVRDAGARRADDPERRGRGAAAGRRSAAPTAATGRRCRRRTRRSPRTARTTVARPARRVQPDARLRATSTRRWPRRWRAAVERFAELGAKVETADPGFADPVEAFHDAVVRGRRQGRRAPDAARPRALLDPGLREICELGAATPRWTTWRATAVRMELGRLMGLFHERVRPAAHARRCRSRRSRRARRCRRARPSPRWTGWTPFTYPFNMTQQPAASVPCGLRARTGCRSASRSSAPGTPTPWSWPRATPSSGPARGPAFDRGVWGASPEVTVTAEASVGELECSGVWAVERGRVEVAGQSKVMTARPRWVPASMSAEDARRIVQADGS